MNLTKDRTSRRMHSFRLLTIILAAAALALSAALSLNLPADAQTTTLEANGFRIGERLTFNVSIGRFRDAAYAELYTVSRGRLGDKDAIELRAKFKTLDLASAASYLIDESRTTYVSPSTGLPLYTSVIENASGLPKETIQNYLAAPTLHADLLTMIHKIRQSGGTGSLTMQENDKVYPVTFQSGVSERQKTAAGEFDTVLVSLQSDFFTEHGMTDVSMNLSTDEAKLPVLVRFRTSKGQFRVSLASVRTTEPEVVIQPTPEPIRTPLPERTPKPVATPQPYVDNQPLPAELGFEIGEKLEYRILSGGQPIATMTLWAKERKQFNSVDSLLLEAVFSNVRPGSPFTGGDFVRAYVDPDSLAPRQIEMRFAGALRAFSSTVKFERQGGLITYGPTNRVEAPVGTHSILSLLYAARSFNLKPSRDLSNPINDTRVAVFWESQPYVFTLRPSPAAVITVGESQIWAQMVTVTTKNPTLDQLNIKIWLGNDDSRIPVRFVVGGYEADLLTTTKIQPK
jgi:hypothetical protein